MNVGSFWLLHRDDDAIVMSLSLLLSCCRASKSKGEVWAKQGVGEARPRGNKG